MIPQMLVDFATREYDKPLRYLAGIVLDIEGLFKLATLYPCTKTAGCQHAIVTVHSLN